MPLSLTRRTLAKGALAATISGPTREADASNQSSVENSNYDPVTYFSSLSSDTEEQLSFRRRDVLDTHTWQAKLREKISDLIGINTIPAHQKSFETRLLSEVEFPRYVRRKFVITARPGMEVPLYTLIPRHGSRPVPAVVCIPGHGKGVTDIIGLRADGSTRSDRAGYQHDFALQVVENGLAAIAVEPFGFGERRDLTSKQSGRDVTTCQQTSGAALLLGSTMLAFRVADVFRIVDWLETQPELDRTRVACMGISGGGTTTLFAAALDGRIQAAMVSGYLNTFRASVMRVPHCIDNYVPGLLRWAEMYDIAGLIAPRPLFIESGRRDQIFPIAASVESFERTKEIYTSLRASDRIQQELFDRDHSFWGVRGIPFLRQALTSIA